MKLFKKVKFVNTTVSSPRVKLATNTLAYFSLVPKVLYVEHLVDIIQ